MTDYQTASLLDLIDSDPRRDNDRAQIDRAVEKVAARDGGVVSTNAVRRELTGPYGLVVLPQAIGPRLRALTLAGVLAEDGWETNDDTAGRNSGKPQRLRRWVGGPL